MVLQRINLRKGNVLKLFGRLVKNTKTIREAFVEKNGDAPFRDMLEESFISLCRELDIQVPIWLKRNTVELARYRKTSFSEEQFTERIAFDRFVIAVEI